MDKRTRGCLWTALGVALLLVMVGGALVVGGGYWFYRQVAPQSETVDQAAAAREFEAVRRRFGGRGPVFDFEESGPGRATVRLRPGAERPETPRPIASIRVLVYNPREGALVRFSIPFWAVRFAPDGKITIGEDGRIVEGGTGTPFTVEELERFGPSLLVDDTDADGEQILVWTE
jgi:hypothetical protein